MNIQFYDSVLNQNNYVVEVSDCSFVNSLKPAVRRQSVKVSFTRCLIADTVGAVGLYVGDSMERIPCYIGCSHGFWSTETYDACGVCGGNNSTCAPPTEFAVRVIPDQLTQKVSQFIPKTTPPWLAELVNSCLQQ